MKHLQKQFETTQSMVDESISFLKQNEPPEGYFVGFSGGKDSIVTLELCRLAKVNHTPYYSATGIDPPEVVKFIRQNYPYVEWLRPKYSFWEGIYKKFPPMRMKRWCCDVLKKDPAKKIPLMSRIMGIRAEESYKRSSRPRVDGYKSIKQMIYKPIFYWKEYHVWDFIEGQGLKYPILYDEGFNRIGCVICPFLPSNSMSRIKPNMERWPNFYKTFEHAVTRWYEKKISQGTVFRESSAQEYIQRWYRGLE